MADLSLRRLGLGALLVVTSTGACAQFTGPAQAPPAPEFNPPGNQSKCRVMKSQSRPLIVEWSSADRAALDVLAQRGTVVVRYEGCEMEVLPRCKAPGSYTYTATTRKTEQVTIRNDDDLYASLPIGAAKLEGKLASHGQLDVTMNVVGQYGTDRTEIARGDLQGDCSKATHVVTGMTVGAFEFTAGAGAEASGGAGALGAGVGGRASRTKEMLSSDGDVAACERATREDKQPPEGCGGLLRIEVAPLGETAGAGAGGVAGGVACPAGTAMVNGTCQSMASALATVVPTRLMVEVSCGMNSAYVGTQDGLRVWIDGERGEPAEEPRAFNPMSPGAQGPVLYVAFDTTPGKHNVRVEADGCTARETTVDIKPGEPHQVMGRLQPTAMFSRPPAGAWSMGIAAEYSWVSLASLKEGADYAYSQASKVSIDTSGMKGVGGAFTFETQHFFFDMGFGHVSGKGTYTHPACTSSICTQPTEAQGTTDVGAWQMPLLFGARFPLQYVSITAGTGFVWSILTLSRDANSDLNVTSPMGAHIPAFVGVEARPLCPLGIGARAQRAFSLGSDVGNFDSLTLTLAYHFTMGCGADDFGIQ